MRYNELHLLEVVKDTFGVPHNLLELDDEKLLHLLTNEVRRNFSKYHPMEKILYVNDANLVDQNSNVFLLPEDEEIINVKSVIDTAYSTMSGLNMRGRVGTDIYDLIDATLMNPGSSRDNQLTFKFQHPNILTVNERFSGELVIKANILHAIDFSTVSYNEIDLLEKYAKISVAERLLGIRRKYGTFNTPIGEIQLDLETINEIIQGKNEFIESERRVGNLSKRVPLIVA